MGSEFSQPDDGKGEKQYENVILPQMILIIEHVLWLPDAMQQQTGCQGTLDYSHKSLDRSYQAIQPMKLGSGPIKETTPRRIWVTASLDGREVGPAMYFPKSNAVREPHKVNPQHPGSVLSLKFRMDAANTTAPTEITIPLYKLIRYGAPLFTTLWLAFPLPGGDYEGGHYDFSQAVAMQRNPNVPKVCITLFKPGRRENMDYHAIAVDPQPDVHGALCEDMDTCTGPVKRGPTAIAQIKGLHMSLRVLSQMVLALQEALFFSSDQNHAELARHLQDTMRSLTGKSDSEYAQVDCGGFWQVQDVLRKMEVEKEQLKSQLEKKDEELEQQAKEQAELEQLRIECSRQKEDLDRTARDLEEAKNLELELDISKRMNLRLKEDIGDLRQLDSRRISITQDHAVTSEELVRAQATLASRERELAEAREELAQARERLRTLPTLETKVQHLGAKLKVAEEEADKANAKCLKQEQDLACSRTAAASLHKRLEDQSAQIDAELKALRTSAQEKIRVEEELGRLRVEASQLRSQKKMLTEDLETECHRWKSELDALRTAKDQQAELQEELQQKAMELEVLKVSQNNQKTVCEAMVKNAEEQEVRNKVEDAVLEETLSKLRQSAPQRLKELREECAALRIKDKQSEILTQEFNALKMELMKKEDEIRSLKEGRKMMEASLQEACEELERKKGECKALRAELEVQRTGEMLQKELVDNMRTQVEALKTKDVSAREDLQEDLAKALAEVKVLRAKLQTTSEFETYAEGRGAADPPGIVTV